jgi:hypothetical protein
MMLMRVFNAGAKRIVARVSVTTAAGWSLLAQYQVAPYATLQSAIPAQDPEGAAITGVSIACSGPCAGLALAAPRGTSANAGPDALWSSALR